jgi:hypothetical protein
MFMLSNGERQKHADAPTNSIMRINLNPDMLTSSVARKVLRELEASAHWRKW